MKNPDLRLTSAYAALRTRAERRLRAAPPAGSPSSKRDSPSATEELHIYEAELQIQNEELIAGRTEIEASQRRYFRHFDLAPVGLIRLNQQALILEANILGARMLGVNRILLQSCTRPFLSHVAPESLGIFQRHLEAAMASGKMEMCELVLRDLRGGETYARMQSVVSPGERETVDFYLTLTDLSERRHIEQKLQKQKELADAAVASKQLFFAMLSHELRTPLTPLSALLQGLADEPGRPAEDLAAFAIMRRNLDLEIHLIDDLLDLTRVTGGKLELQCETTDLQLCLTNAVEICHSHILDKGLDLEFDLGAARHFVKADASRLQQVFWNLIKNAVKFTTAPGKITVELRCDSESEVTVEFRDTGIGIAADSLSRIFDPFFQVDATARHRVGGLGLGLAICKSIADAHGGTLTATSAGLGRGTTFRLTLPTVPAPDAALQAEPAERDPGLRRDGLRLLLVEDDEDSRNVLARLLRLRGYIVEAAGDAAAAHALCAQKGFDLLVTDIGLPADTGYDLLKELHARYGLRGIAMSGFGSEADLADGREAGFLEYLIKPVDAGVLDTLIQQVAARFPSELREE